MKEFLIPTNKGGKIVFEKNIVRIEANSNYCKIYFINEEPLLVAKVLHWFEINLPKDIFCRIHRGHLINRSYIKCFYGCNEVSLSNGDVVKMSRRKMPMFKHLVAESA